MTTHSPPGYRSYLLRFWEERAEQPAATVWRFSLEDPLTAQRLNFADLPALVAWLQVETAPGLDAGFPAGGSLTGG